MSGIVSDRRSGEIATGDDRIDANAVLRTHDVDAVPDFRRQVRHERIALQQLRSQGGAGL